MLLLGTACGLHYTLDLGEFVLDGNPISFTASVTRLTTSGGFRGHDIRLGLSDGRIFVFGDYPNLSTNPNVSPRHAAGGIRNGGRNFTEYSPFGITDAAGWNFGETANLGVTIRATPFATRITTSFNGYRIFTSTASAVESLDASRGLKLTIRLSHCMLTLEGASTPQLVAGVIGCAICFSTFLFWS